MKVLASVDPLLQVAIAQLVQQHGREAVLAAAQAVPKHARGQATRGQLEEIHTLMKQLYYPREVFNPYQFCELQIRMGIPEGITIEVLGILVRRQPHPAPWALVNKVMAEDYPHYRWGSARGQRAEGSRQKAGEDAIGGTSDED